MSETISIAEVIDSIELPESFKDYTKAVGKYYLGMNEEEIANDKIGRKDTAKRIVDFLRHLGAHNKKINLDDEITDHDNPSRDRKPLRQKIEEIRKTEPEFAYILTSAITLQQTLHNENNLATLFDTLRGPFSDGYSSDFAWNKKDAKKIVDKGFDAIERQAGAEITALLKAFEPLIEEEELDPDDAGYQYDLEDIIESFNNLITGLRYENEFYDTTDEPLTEDAMQAASEALKALDKKILSLPNIPRIVRNRFVGHLLEKKMIKQKTTS